MISAGTLSPRQPGVSQSIFMEQTKHDLPLLTDNCDGQSVNSWANLVSAGCCGLGLTEDRKRRKCWGERIVLDSIIPVLSGGGAEHQLANECPVDPLFSRTIVQGLGSDYQGLSCN